MLNISFSTNYFNFFSNIFKRKKGLFGTDIFPLLIEFKVTQIKPDNKLIPKPI